MTDNENINAIKMPSLIDRQSDYIKEFEAQIVLNSEMKTLSFKFNLASAISGLQTAGCTTAEVKYSIDREFGNSTEIMLTPDTNVKGIQLNRRIFHDSYNRETRMWVGEIKDISSDFNQAFFDLCDDFILLSGYYGYKHDDGVSGFFKIDLPSGRISLNHYDNEVTTCYSEYEFDSSLQTS